MGDLVGGWFDSTETLSLSECVVRNRLSFQCSATRAQKFSKKRQVSSRLPSKTRH